MTEVVLAPKPKTFKRAHPFDVRDEDGNLDPHAEIDRYLDSTTSGLYPPEITVSEVTYPGDVVVAVTVYGKREDWKFAAADGGNGGFFIGENFPSFVAARDAMKALLDNIHKAEGRWWSSD